MRICRVLNKTFMSKLRFNFSVERMEHEGASFLRMVENYFDKAARHTGISSDKLAFYKVPENVLKFTLTLVRGIHPSDT